MCGCDAGTRIKRGLFHRKPADALTAHSCRLRPEYSPEPTQPNSDMLVLDSDGNWNIENTLEEEERIRNEDEEEKQLNEKGNSSEAIDDSEGEEIKIVKNKSKIKDINW
ncbi:uncharacterized protein MELLADRAFT_107958 [Melampsora larici-populina 98AG31]|uniref:Uncharacterized protein n=1 Tax=Melampsora larici-populina (strain 98AG31 / pathotype 3-4-7) TaxID=747676 RepID=F4RRI0_MELLP|nr:uncharacterized protein MELLADRAFT_107958 [Melampsora larici-populina 98AG31]EGG04938.1 hypothetical protein MELLADRAFT_107958 [Melampsora larici-populina 98AG31]